MAISRDQVVNRLRDADWTFKRVADRVEIYRLRGSTKRINLSRRKQFEETYVVLVLSQAGLSKREIEDFMKTAIKS